MLPFSSLQDKVINSLRTVSQGACFGVIRGYNRLNSIHDSRMKKSQTAHISASIKSFSGRLDPGILLVEEYFLLWVLFCLGTCLLSVLLCEQSLATLLKLASSSLCIPGWPQTSYLPAAAVSQVLRMQACKTIRGLALQLSPLTAANCYLILNGFTASILLASEPLKNRKRKKARKILS